MFVKRLKLSVVIPTHNRALSLSRALQSLVIQTVHPYEIIVVNNGSTDSTDKIIGEYSLQLPIVHVKKRACSYALTRNIGVYKAKGDIIALMDDDCEAETDWAQKILQAHRHGTYVVQGIGIENPLSKNIYSFIHNLRSQEGYLYGLSLSTTSCLAGKKTYPVVAIMDNKNVSFSRKLLKLINPWYAEWLPPHICADDVELAQRLTLANIQIIFNQEIRVFHRGRSSLGALLQRNFEYGKNDRWIQALHNRQPIINAKAWKSFHTSVRMHYFWSFMTLLRIDIGLFRELMDSSQFPGMVRIYGIFVFLLAKSIRKAGYIYENKPVLSKSLG